MPTQRPTSFLTLEDPNAKIKGSRDPLAAQPIWAAFGRHVVTNLTTQSTSVRGFTTLLMGRYFAAELVDKGMASREDALDVFLRMEQLSAYVRYVAPIGPLAIFPGFSPMNGRQSDKKYVRRRY